MAPPMTLGQTTTAYTKWHVPYKVWPGAATRGRPGGIVPIGITEHHTGGGSASASYLRFLFEIGRPAEGIPGPLCNEATAPDGTVWIGATGRANHAGSGSVRTREAVGAEDYAGYTTELAPGPDGLNGNPLYYGNEWIYSGVVPPTPRQYRAAVLAATARLDFHGWSALSVIAHREHTRRKHDPYGVNMAKFRRDVRTCLTAGPAACARYVATGTLIAPIPADIPSGGPMTLTTADLDAIESRAYDGAMRANRDYGRLLWGEGGTAGEFMQRTDARLVDHTLRLIRIEDDTDDGTAVAALLSEAAPLLEKDGATGTAQAVPCELDEPNPQDAVR